MHEKKDKKKPCCRDDKFVEEVQKIMDDEETIYRLADFF